MDMTPLRMHRNQRKADVPELKQIAMIRKGFDRFFLAQGRDDQIGALP